MSDAELPPRPRQLMLAAGVVIGGSAFLLAAVFDALGNLQSVDTREQLQKVVSSSTGRDLGVTLDQAIDALRAALNLTAVCAAIAVVLGIFVLQRHRGARIALTVVAVPLLVTAPLVGGFLGALVAVATLMLWGGPAGDWYAGRPVRRAEPAQRQSPPPRHEPPGPPAPPSAPSSVPAASTGSSTSSVPAPAAAPPPAPSTADPSTEPPATDSFGVPPDAAETPPGTPAGPPVAATTTPPGWPDPPATSSAPRPVSVRLACILTWMFSGSVALLYLAAVLVLLVDRSAVVDRVLSSPAWRDSGLDDDLLVPVLWVGVLLFLAWSLGAVVLAWFTWRRHDWARYLLAASAGMALLVAAIAFPVGLLHQLASAATVGALFAPRSRAWFASREPTRPPDLPPPPAPRHGPW